MAANSQLQSNVLDELKWRPGVNAAQIGGTVTNSVVTLTGQETRYAETSAAEGFAKGAHGFKVRAMVISVTLTGTLDCQYQRDATAPSVHNLMGVIAVSNPVD